MDKELTADLFHGPFGIMIGSFAKLSQVSGTINIRATLTHQSGLLIEYTPTESLGGAVCECQSTEGLQWTRSSLLTCSMVPLAS